MEVDTGDGEEVQGSKDYDPVKMKAVVGNKRSKRKFVSADVAGDWLYQSLRCVYPSADVSVCMRVELSTAGLNGQGGAGRRWITLRLSQARGLIAVETALCLTQHVLPPVNTFFSYLAKQPQS